jgi:hypothetical protein
MLNRLKVSFVLILLALVVVFGAYVYSLWTAQKQKTADLPFDATGMMIRDLLAFHKKRGGFPENLKQLEGVVWGKKSREFSSGNRALNHRNYYYLYTRIAHHHFTLWAIPVGKSREEAPTWFLIATPDKYGRWKGPALPFELIQKIEPIPPRPKLAVLGLIEQTPIDLRNQSNDTQTAPSRR